MKGLRQRDRWRSQPRSVPAHTQAQAARVDAPMLPLTFPDNLQKRRPRRSHSAAISSTCRRNSSLARAGWSASALAYPTIAPCRSARSTEIASVKATLAGCSGCFRCAASTPCEVTRERRIPSAQLPDEASRRAGILTPPPLVGDQGTAQPCLPDMRKPRCLGLGPRGAPERDPPRGPPARRSILEQRVWSSRLVPTIYPFGVDYVGCRPAREPIPDDASDPLRHWLGLNRPCQDAVWTRRGIVIASTPVTSWSRRELSAFGDADKPRTTHRNVKCR